MGCQASLIALETPRGVCGRGGQMKSNNPSGLEVFKPLPSANGPQNTLSSTHLADLLSFPSALRDGGGGGGGGGEVIKLTKTFEGIDVFLSNLRHAAIQQSEHLAALSHY
ncbi:unnamed protein product [Pleuronectes platessa]|uniref:Uncharacterized protein n=1 Tax=Pleuronectes platessa TaxID=8262 RepID=A0A9N7VIA2_PLEPL|nr:unnamed protein product [Pleuronectes platessa]